MSPNPMREARAALALHPCCGAHCCTTGKPCRSPSMPNGRCRMHGGKSPGAPKGIANGKFKHGMFTAQAIEDRRASRELIKVIRLIMERG